VCFVGGLELQTDLDVGVGITDLLKGTHDSAPKLLVVYLQIVVVSAIGRPYNDLSGAELCGHQARFFGQSDGRLSHLDVWVCVCPQLHRGRKAKTQSPTIQLGLLQGSFNLSCRTGEIFVNAILVEVLRVV